LTGSLLEALMRLVLCIMGVALVLGGCVAPMSTMYASATPVPSYHHIPFVFVDWPSPAGDICLPKVGYDPERRPNEWQACTRSIAPDLSKCDPNGFGLGYMLAGYRDADLVRHGTPARARMAHTAN